MTQHDFQDFLAKAVVFICDGAQSKSCYPVEYNRGG